MKSKIWPVVIGLGILGVIGFVIFALTRPEVLTNNQISNKSSDPNVVSENGLHYHPKLVIYINGEKQTIPSGIGLTGTEHKSPHTHDETGELHWENQGRVTKDDLRMGKLFESMGKKFTSTELLDKTDPSGSKITMTVNGEKNLELGNHLVADKEEIEIRYQD